MVYTRGGRAVEEVRAVACMPPSLPEARHEVAVERACLPPASD